MYLYIYIILYYIILYRYVYIYIWWYTYIYIFPIEGGTGWIYLESPNHLIGSNKNITWSNVPCPAAGAPALEWDISVNPLVGWKGGVQNSGDKLAQQDISYHQIASRSQQLSTISLSISVYNIVVYHHTIFVLLLKIQFSGTLNAQHDTGHCRPWPSCRGLEVGECDVKSSRTKVLGNQGEQWLRPTRWLTDD